MDLSVYEAKEYFKKSVAEGKRFEALLITENGRPEEKLLGIITPAGPDENRLKSSGHSY